jgi:hypothetical protein
MGLQLWTTRIVNGNDAVSDQEISKFFVSHVEEYMARHVGVMEFIKNQGGELQKGMVGGTR